MIPAECKILMRRRNQHCNYQITQFHAFCVIKRIINKNEQAATKMHCACFESLLNAYSTKWENLCQVKASRGKWERHRRFVTKRKRGRDEKRKEKKRKRGKEEKRKREKMVADFMRYWLTNVMVSGFAIYFTRSRI